MHLQPCSPPSQNPHLIEVPSQPFASSALGSEPRLNSLRCHLLALSSRRVFGDKLVCHEDKGWLDKQLAELCKHEFPPELCKQVGAGLHAWTCSRQVPRRMRAG